MYLFLPSHYHSSVLLPALPLQPVYSSCIQKHEPGSMLLQGLPPCRYNWHIRNTGMQDTPQSGCSWPVKHQQQRLAASHRNRYTVPITSLPFMLLASPAGVTASLSLMPFRVPPCDMILGCSTISLDSVTRRSTSSRLTAWLPLIRGTPRKSAGLLNSHS